jgi:hypothetical protein
MAEVLGLSAAFALALGCPGSAQTRVGSETIPVDKQVTITFDGKDRIDVQPDVFVAKLGGPGVEFVVKGLPERFRLEIDFKSQANVKGPFVRGAGPRGRYDVLGTGKDVAVQSGKVDPDRVKGPAYWKYEVVVRDPEGNDRVAMDPGGVFR